LNSFFGAIISLPGVEKKVPIDMVVLLSSLLLSLVSYSSRGIQLPQSVSTVFSLFCFKCFNLWIKQRVMQMKDAPTCYNWALIKFQMESLMYNKVSSRHTNVSLA